MKSLQRIEYFNSPSPIKSGGLQQPHITLLFGIARIQYRLGQGIRFPLNFRILPSHIPHKIFQKPIDLFVHLAGTITWRCGGTLTSLGLVLQEKIQELFEVILTVLIIEVHQKRDGGQTEQFYFAALAVYLQVADQSVLGSYLMVALEVVYHLADVVAGHLFVAEVVYVRHPLEIGDGLYALLQLFPVGTQLQ